jgi:hypothetical protein
MLTWLSILLVGIGVVDTGGGMITGITPKKA